MHRGKFVLPSMKKLKVEQLGGYSRPMFITRLEARRSTVMQDDMLDGIKAAKEWEDFQKSEFPEFEAAKKPSRLSTDTEVIALMEDIRRLERGHIDTKTYNSRDTATYVFSTPKTLKDASTMKATITYNEQYTQECWNRPQEHNILMDGFARYNEERIKFKSGRATL